MLDKATVREIAAKYTEEVRKVLNPSAVILFGSYVNGTPHEWSDIDIAVILNGYDGNWLETASLLCGLTRQVSIDIEPHLLDETCDGSGFVEHIFKTGEIIYRAA
ncbi:MAG: nucleotidyltransferase domain-containing protein [Oscillospiraceae bacterium]|jgi:predicted nucleotidyltransferase|nr:nucleotidyltransferase domain-containing protein [Oscillospiraceae bacterium]